MSYGKRRVQIYNSITVAERKRMGYRNNINDRKILFLQMIQFFGGYNEDFITKRTYR